MLSILTGLGARSRVVSMRLLARLGLREESFLILPSVLIGIVTAAAAVGFHLLIYRIRDWLYYSVAPPTLYGAGLPLLIAFPALGGLVVGLFSRYLVRTREGHGIIDVIESVIRTSGFIRPISALEKIFTSAVTIGTGGSGGAEGPIVQIGAAIASGFGQVFRFARHEMPILIGCGSAAGISAIFNAPIGGVLFTLEVILQDFSIRTFTPLVISSFIANVTTRAIFARIEGSEYPAIFAMPAQASANAPTIVDWAQAGNFVLLGLICGVAGVMLTKLMGVFETRFRKLNLSSALKPALGGALLGVLGIAYVLILGRVLLHQPKPFAFEQYPMPAFFSDGYGVIQNLLRGEFYVHWDAGKIVLLLAFLSLAKILATCLTLGSGGSGGIIAPSLFIGATAGGCLGMVLQQTHWFGALHPEVYALVGMGAVLAAVVHAPLASIIILFELTADYRVTLPAMITTVTAVGIARLMFPDSIYTHTLRMRGIKWGSASDLSVLRRMNVEQVELEPATVLQVSEPVQKALDLAAQLGSANFVATDAEGTYQGMVVTDQLNQALIERDVVPLTIVGDVMRSDIPPVKNTDDLATVFEMFCQTEMAYLPVCLASRPGKVIGLISRNALMRTYQGQWAGGERSG